MQLQQSSTFEMMEREEFEEIVFFHDSSTGLKAIVAIHDTTLGPALGGTRMWSYRSELDALRDVMRLAKAMTYKAAAAGLSFGGGKGVIIGDPKRDKSEVLLRSYGRYVQSLGGRFITAEDVGTTLEDMRVLMSETRHVAGTSIDPSPFTAYGVYCGIKACLEYVFGDESLDGVHVAVQGVGKVGGELVRLLLESGARVTVTDVDASRVRRFIELGASYVEPGKIYSVQCDVFSPCALGGVLNDSTVKRLRCSIVAGAANNQLESESVAERLSNLGILYAPDYIINAGGLIAVAKEYECARRGREPSTEEIMRDVERIRDRLEEVFRMSESSMGEEMVITTSRAAEMLARRRIEEARRLKGIYLPD
ncbi:leucine dehydrogenase [Geoglobus ahangari]|uniref:Leucine dehydrogenase n=1 Tax=Geoglobus ahangari TaxID=113653 RepID=A0A0F7IFZ8_9EURY|nr:Glu/Leu/Phe/Val dehydrogenase dimerization domain-containing protein [Geoglobus ahangari]AKG92084.1 leucine dehydrogenase [Geoglobus ahangari]